MSDWSHGYNISEGYTHGFYRELAPDWIDLALTIRGIRPPPRCAAGRYRYLELGCGQGFGLCLLAAANPNGDFVGIDFSPEHVAHAQELASTLELRNVSFIEADFEQLGASWPEGLGSFEYVVLHGIYSWVSANLRRAIVNCLRAGVAPGGTVYLSYNAMPGWASTIPFQHFLRLLDRQGIAKGALAIDKGRDLFKRLNEAESALSKALPALNSRIASTGSQSAAYLVQEYLHDNWHPLWSSQVHAELSLAKLTRAATATLPENLLPGMLPEGHRQVLNDFADPIVQEDLMDALINQSFRRDLYTRGGLSRLPGDRQWRERFYFRRANSEQVPEKLEVKTSFGSLTLRSTRYDFILGSIGEGEATFDDILATAPGGTEPGSIMQVIVLLIHNGWLTFGSSDGLNSPSLDEVNRRIASRVAQGGPYRYLAASRAGTAVHASDLEMLLFDSYKSGGKDFTTDALAGLRARLNSLGKRVMKNGAELDRDAEDAQLRQVTQSFITRTLPIWRRLGVTN